MACAQPIRPSRWSGKALPGNWLVTFKVDGVRALWCEERGWISRAGNPLFNIPPYRAGPRDCELYVRSFEETIRATRKKLPLVGTPIVTTKHLYGLDQIDSRLVAGTLRNPTKDEIFGQLERALALQFEGIVLRQADQWIKIKSQETCDLPILGFVEGRGKHKNTLGVVLTSRGKVSSGLKDAERARLWEQAQAGRLIGQIVEVACMEFTARGMFRHPRFVRMRPDKSAA